MIEATEEATAGEQRHCSCIGDKDYEAAIQIAEARPNL